MSKQQNIEMAQAIYDAYNNRDFDRSLSLTAEDVEVTNVPLGLTFRGRTGYRQFQQTWATAFPDSKVEVTHRVADDNGVVTEFRGIGTHTGPLAGPAGDLPATGRPVNIQFCEVFEIKNGKISKDRLYFDLAGLMSQLGLAG